MPIRQPQACGAAHSGAQRAHASAVLPKPAYTAPPHQPTHTLSTTYSSRPNAQYAPQPAAAAPQAAAVAPPTRCRIPPPHRTRPTAGPCGSNARPAAHYHGGRSVCGSIRAASASTWECETWRSADVRLRHRPGPLARAEHLQASRRRTKPLPSAAAVLIRKAGRVDPGRTLAAASGGEADLRTCIHCCVSVRAVAYGASVASSRCNLHVFVRRDIEEQAIGGLAATYGARKRDRVILVVQLSVLELTL